MVKYYLITWPDSQYYMDCPEAIQSDGMSFFVPCEIVDNNDKTQH